MTYYNEGEAMIPDNLSELQRLEQLWEQWDEESEQENEENFFRDYLEEQKNALIRDQRKLDFVCISILTECGKEFNHEKNSY